MKGNTQQIEPVYSDESSKGNGSVIRVMCSALNSFKGANDMVFLSL